MATVLVPWRGGCEHRERAWAYLEEAWWPQPYSLQVCEPPPGPWCKAAALMPAVAEVGDIVILADADCWTEGIDAAVEAVATGAADWAMPHLKVHRLTEQGTAAVLAGADPMVQDCERPAYEGMPGGGIVVVRRDVLLEVPLDPRFLGWGREDVSWREAMTTLVGKPWQGKARLFHLWHPPQPEQSARRLESRNPASEALFSRYLAARRKPDQMRALIAEAVAALPTTPQRSTA